MEVQVEYEHMEGMAKGMGFQTAQTIKALEEDNLERIERQMLPDPRPEESDQEDRQSDCERGSVEEEDSEME